MSASPSQSLPALGLHRGAIDLSTVTTLSPPDVMRRVDTALKSLAISTEAESEYKLFCTRPRKATSSFEATPSAYDKDEEEEETENMPTPRITPRQLEGEVNPDASIETSYGDQEPGDEVRFSVELTKLEGLSATYSLDIRRMKGNLRSYKFVYDSVRERANLQAT